MVNITYIGGPTALIEMDGLRLLTDPTFDPAGSEYQGPGYTLCKTLGPALAASSLGRIDAVLLSHDHHFDNLDTAGRELLATAAAVFTTEAGAARLGGQAIGMKPWDTHDLVARDGRTVRLTATPARHGPEHGDRGPVIGFVLDQPAGGEPTVYVSGDTVLYDAVVEVARRFRVAVAVLFMGSARVAAAGPPPLTFTASEGVAAARIFGDATVVPLHYEGWAHFSENRDDIAAAFAAAGLQERLRWLQPGVRAELDTIL